MLAWREQCVCQQQGGLSTTACATSQPSYSALLQFAPALGSVGLATYLAGELFRRALERKGLPGKACIGQDCFQLTFLVRARLPQWVAGWLAWHAVLRTVPAAPPWEAQGL